MRFFELAPLVAALANLILALFVLRRDSRAVVNRVFVLWGISVAVWNLGAHFLFFRNAENAWFWAHVLQAGVIFLPVFNLHLCLLIAQVSLGRWLVVLYGIHAAFAASLVSGHFIVGIRDLGYAYYSVAGIGFYGYLVGYAFTTVFALRLLYAKQRVLPSMHRARVRWMMAAISLLALFGTNDLLPVLQIYTYPFTNKPIYPVGNFAAIFYVAIVGYSVLQHQLLDIHVAITRVATFVVRFAAAAAVACALMLLAWVLVGFSATQILAALAVALGTCLVTALAFPRLLGPGEEKLERWILGNRYGYHDEIRQFIAAMQSYPNPQNVLPELRSLLLSAVRLRSFEVILLDETTRGFSLAASYPERLLAPVQGLHADAPLFRYFQSKVRYLPCNISYAMPGETELERAARRQIRDFNPEFCFAFFSDTDPVGFLSVGAKINGDSYTPEDLRLLTEMVQTLSLVFNQVRLKSQILMSQEQELLGRMSRGLAHDLNNLLTPVQTFLQLNAQDLLDEESRAELLPVASRNIETVRAYVNEALFFSRTHALDVKPRRLDDAIRSAVELMQLRARDKDIEINIQGLTALIVEMDEVMIQRMLSNLISNAVDASPPGGSLKIQLIRLPRTETSREWIRIKIIDGGEGISADNLQRIFTPYFTTKNRGDGKRGFGLGLAISRKIVHLHGGNLTVNSVENKGTTVQVDLPSRHTFNPARNPELKDATYDASYK